MMVLLLFSALAAHVALQVPLLALALPSPAARLRRMTSRRQLNNIALPLPWYLSRRSPHDVEHREV
jgi:hypothetical protein